MSRCAFCLLLSNMVDNLDKLCDDEQLYEAWVRAGLRLQSVTDQHAAMTEDLETLAPERSTSCRKKTSLRSFAPSRCRAACSIFMSVRP